MGDAAIRRTDSAARFIKAPPHVLYRAFVNADALAQWLPPLGMTAEIFAFQPRAGGALRMALNYEADGQRGKTEDNKDVVEGRFVELVENERIVWAVTFKSDDPSFAGEMKMTWSFAPAPGGTEVTIIAENVPPGISKEDHDAGLRSTLENLAAFIE
ncbi:SRPBCC family protein [Chelativorans sp. J32]|uniref:SRPBCC family protein n=1 Tax=Chelativorans sp. J32 TaxID=935840 RepID=UPI0004851631|nr:SRPBCC family protein [Chelativorans sp. J32]